MTTYSAMTAQELHEIVTRLEAKGFKLPENIQYVAVLRTWMWTVRGRHIFASFAAAIIEVAARDWWLEKYYENDLVVGLGRTWARDARDSYGGPTPLHAIAAAVEAK